MRIWIAAVPFLLLPACACVVAQPARAQLMDSLKGAAGMGSSSGSGVGSLGGGGLGGGGLGGGGLGGMAMPSVGSASSGNVAGVLGYCVRNNYLSGDGASSVQSGLMGKLGGNTAHSSQYESGSQGELQTGNGQHFSLGSGGGGSGGLKARMTQKVCAQVLKHAKSLM